MDLRDNLKFYREKAGYKTAKDFAAALNLPYNTYSSYENQKREPKLETLIKMADLLKISTDELLGRRNNILNATDDEQIRKTFKDTFDYFDYDLIHVKDISDKEISFYLGTNLRYGEIKIDKSFFIDCFNKASIQGNDIKRTLIFNTVITKIFDTAVKGLDSDIENNENIIKAYYLLKSYKQNKISIKDLLEKLQTVLKDVSPIEQLEKEMQSKTVEKLDTELSRIEKSTQLLKDIQIRVLRFQNYSENKRRDITITKKQYLKDDKTYQDILKLDKKIDE